MNSLTYKNIETVKTGQRIPIFTDGRAMYSRYNPERDAQIFAAGITETAGCILVCGLGNGMHITALKQKHPQAKIIVAEASDENIRFLKEHFDLSDIYGDQSIVICAQEHIEQTILTAYIPLLHGNFVMAPLRSWADFHADRICDIREQVTTALEKLAADTSTQAHFGKIWHRNILQNILIAQNIRTVTIPKLRTCRKALIIAAGPSVDTTNRIAKGDKDSYFIIAVDTALPALRKRDITPDVVVTIDGSTVSASHFYGKIQPEIIVVADLCACPAAVRHAAECGCPVLFTRNKHPLSLLASEYFKDTCGCGIPELDSGSGTVTITALDFAVQAGFTDITVLGADFGYSAGKPYTKGIYLDDAYNSRATRILPQEQQFSALMYRTPLYLNATGSFSNKTLDSYRNAFYSYIKNHPDAKINWNSTIYHAQKKVKQDNTQYINMLSGKYDGTSFINWYLELLYQKDQKVIPSILPLAAWSKSKLDYKNDIFSLLKLAYTQTVRYTDKHYGT